jgi:hypothetical protein
MHAVGESEVELDFGGANAGSSVGHLGALGLVLIELLRAHWFWKVMPSWQSGRWRPGDCRRELRSRARQRDRIRRQGYGVSQPSCVGAARGQRQGTDKDNNQPAQSPRHVPLTLNQSGQTRL